MADCCNDKNRILIDQFFNNINSDKRDEKLLKHLDDCFSCRNYYIERQKETELNKLGGTSLKQGKIIPTFFLTQKTSMLKLLPIIILLAIAVSLIPKLKSFNKPAPNTSTQTSNQPSSGSETK